MENTKEEWRLLKGYEWKYEVSNLGRVRSLNYRKTGKTQIMKQTEVADGYFAVRLKKTGSTKLFRVHRLVAETFIPNPNNYKLVNHKDENKKNNCVSNLEWCTAKYNICYGSNLEKKQKKTYQYDKKFNLIRVWKSTMEAHKNGYNNSNICRCCNKKRKTHKGYIWSYEPIKKH